MVLLVLTSTTLASALSCTQPKLTNVEENICSSKELLQLDRQLNQYFATLKSKLIEPEPLIVEQRFWIKKIRDACKNVKCIRNVYKRRILVISDFSTTIAWNENMLGQYYYDHDVESFNPNGLHKSQVTDTMTLSRHNNRIKLSVITHGSMNNICELQGHIEIESSNEKKYRVITINKDCKLSLIFTKGFIQLNDKHGLCRIDACGNRLGLDGKIFLSGSKSFQALKSY